MSAWRLPEVEFAVRVTNEKICASPTFCLATGNTGAGKTTLVQAFLAGCAGNACIQSIIIDPKIVSFADARPRFHVLAREEEWLQALVALSDEVQRRYRLMAERGLESFPVSEEEPFILLVVEEAPAVIGASSFLTKREADEARANLTKICRMGRQAAVGVWVLSQTAFTESVPSSIRSNLLQRIVLRAGSDEEAAAASGRSADEVPATVLIPGEAFMLTTSTNQRFVRARAFSPEKVRFARTMRECAHLKRPLAFLEARGVRA